MRNGRIGEHALDVGLRNGGEVSDRHGSDGYDAEQSRPMILDRPENSLEQAHQERETCGGAGDAEICGDRSGRAFVNVGRPLMKRHGGDLEEQAGGDGDQREQHERIGRLAVNQLVGDDDYVGGGGHSVEQRESVGQNAGAERAEKQIF